MNNHICLASEFEAVIDWQQAIKALARPRITKPSFTTAGRFVAEGLDQHGNVIWRDSFKNGTCNGGLDNMLSVYLGAGTQIVTWYMGLINNSGFSTLSAADTMSSHAGWAETHTTYDEATRPIWNPAAVSGQAITNTTSVSFTINTSITVAGAFLVSNSTKGGTTGILWATGQFTTSQSLTNGQTLRITYTCTASAA